MRSIIRSTLFAVTLFAGNILHAQLQLSSTDLAGIESTTPLSADEMPFWGNYYSAANPGFPPLPENVLGLPGWSLGDGNYLLNDSDSGGTGGGFSAMDYSEPPYPGGDGSADGTIFSGESFPTNGLYLQITNVSNGLVYANLSGATDTVYEIYSTTNLALAATAVTNWGIETEVFPGINTNTMPFSVPMNDRNPLFLWARDWTGITNNGNVTPDWWLYEWFGIYGLSFSDNELDPQGNTLLYDYHRGNDPNVIQFSVSGTIQYVNTNLIPLQLNIQAGIPDYIALVNSTNFIPAGETWYPYVSSNIVVSLSSVEDQQDIWIGLKGLPTNATVTWEEAVFDLNTNAPVIIVTNPVSSTVCKPLIQVQGLVSGQSSSLTFDVSNALQVLTNQTGYAGGSSFDTNSSAFTNNVFQLYDVRLTNGLNAIAIHATDIWGNVMTTNLGVTLDYSSDTNPPTLTVEWPPDGTSIAGSSFTLQAQVDDITATVTASIDGQTNTGIVQRNGQVRGLTLPLAGGTNIVTLTATDAAGNSVTTNLTVAQSVVTLTIDPISSDQVNQPSVNVTGTVSDTNAAVTVNGISATVDGSGNWSADGVTVSATGVAIIEATASDPTNDPVQDLVQPQPPILEVRSMHDNYFFWDDDRLSDGGCWVPEYAQLDREHWENGLGGTAYDEVQRDDGHCGDPVETSSGTTALATNYFTYSADYYYANDSESGTYPGGDLWTIGDDENYDVVLANGGEGQPGTLQTFLILGSARYQASESSPYYKMPPEGLKILGHRLLNSEALNDDGLTNGVAIVSIPAGASLPNFMPSAPYKLYEASVQQINPLQIVDADTGSNLSAQVNTVIVGQQMNLACQLTMTNAALNNSTLSNFQWTVPGYAISNYVVAPDASSAYVETNFPTTNSNVQFYWAGGAYSQIVQCSATINGATVTGQAVFNVLRPMATINTYTASVVMSNVNDIRFGQFVPFAYGIIFSNMVTVPDGFSGSNEWVQVVNSDREEYETTDSVWHIVTKLGEPPYLDTQYPYQLATNEDSSTTEDGPSYGGLYGFPQPYDMTVEESFTMWLMFKPGGGQWVPLKAVDWYWGGVGTNNIPDSYSGWGLASSTWSPNPTDYDPSTYRLWPEWNSNITNFVYTTNSLP